MSEKTDAETCGVCAHFVKADDTNGACFRYPPTGYPIPVQQNHVAVPGQPQAGISVIAVRAPVAAATLACGEFDPVGGTDSQ